jgi:transposase, IS5 family
MYCQRLAHKRYEYGTKASIAITKASGIVRGALALPGDAYDGHTIDVVLKQLKRITGTQPDIMIADSGYRGEKYFGKTQLQTPSRPDAIDTECQERKQR